MLRKSLLRATRRPTPLLRKPYRRRYETEPPKPPPTSQFRIERFNRRLPRFLHKYTKALANAPLSHITSFLILHELTAIIPLFGLAGCFHYTHWLPPWFAEGAWVTSGVERFGRYFKRKGWIRSEEAAEAEREIEEIRSDDSAKADKVWNISEGGVRLLVEFATAYAIVKMFLIPRIVFSVWATPWFARMTVIPSLRRFKNLFAGAKTKGSRAPIAGTEAVKGGTVVKSESGKSL